MADLFVSKELKAYLIAQGVGIHPPAKDLALGTGTSIWLQPRDGAPQPRYSDKLAGYQESATITLVEQDTGSPTGELDAYLEETFVDVIVRSIDEAPGKLLHRIVRGLIHPIGATNGRQLWTMNGLLVEYSTVWRSERPAGTTPVDYTRTASYRFGCRRKALAGLPYAP